MSENTIFSYTHRDYEGSRKEGLAQIPILSKGNWTDLNVTDPGIIILDYVHALVDMMQYYLDHQAMETFISTAKERANIFRLAKQLCYEIRSAKGATCDVTFNSSLFYDHIIRIPKHTSVSTDNKLIKYLTKEDAYLPVGSSSVVVPCYQGEIKTYSYQGTGISRLSTTVANATNQSIRLTDTTIDIDTIVVTDSLGTIWTPVDYIVFSDEGEKSYQVDLNPDNTVTILFGDEERGYVPKNTDNLTITYIVTLAEEGRVGAGSLIVLEDSVIDDQGKYIEFSVRNAEASSGGSYAQSSSEIRELAPGALKTQQRAVTLLDFENLAKMIDGVADAKAYDRNIDPSILHHEVKVLVIPNESVTSTEVLKSTVYEYLSKRMIPPTNLSVLSPTSELIPVTIRIRKIDSYSSVVIEYQVRKVIEDYFKEASHRLHEDLYPTDMIPDILKIEGVRSIISLEPSSTITLGEFAVAELDLDNLNISIE